MFQIATFRCHPAGETFRTSPMFQFGPRFMRGDRADTYMRAHLAAAAHAATMRRLAYVTRDDVPGKRCGFGPSAAFTETTVLYRINQLGLGSYFDYRECAWLPLPAEELKEGTLEGSVVPTKPQVLV